MCWVRGVRGRQTGWGTEMGLLDSMFGGDAQRQGLLAAGFGMMGGPSRTPVSLGQSLGQGYQAGQAAYQNAIQQERAKQADELQAFEPDQFA